jgi:hypothetical protein
MNAFLTSLKPFETKNVYAMITRSYEFPMRRGEGAAVQGISSGLNTG